MLQKIKKMMKGICSSERIKMLSFMLLVGTVTAFAQNAAGDYSAGTTALGTVTEEINFGVNSTKYNTCIKSYLSNNNISYTMNYSAKVNYNNT